MFKNSFSLKFISFIMALFVWFFAKRGTESIEMSFFIPLVFKNLPINMQITSPTPSLVNVSVVTTKRRSNVFNPSELQAVLDLKNARPGNFPYVLGEDNIVSSEKITLIRVTPSQIDLTVEEVIEKSIKIQPRYQGQVSKGHVLKQIILTPDTVIVKGPKSIVDSLTTVNTRTIDLSDLESSLELAVRLDLPDPSVQFINKNVDYYRASISIDVIPVKRRIDKIPLQLVNETYVSQITPGEVNIHVEGAEELVESLEQLVIKGNIDVKGLEPGKYKLSPTFNLPSGVVALQPWPIINVLIKNQTLGNEGAPGVTPMGKFEALKKIIKKT